jgi:hypoxanthine phosphoribosyltransferase
MHRHPQTPMDDQLISLFRVAVKKKFDAIIPIKRKGAAVLRRVRLMNAVPQLEQMKVLDTDRLVETDIKGKRIAIFDDAIASGTTVNTLLDKVKKLKPKYVSTVTLVARYPVAGRIYAKHRVKPKMFKEWMKKRLKYYFQLGFPLDTDHLVINYELVKSPKAGFVHLLKECVKDVGMFQNVSKTKGTEMATIEISPKVIYNCLPQQLPDFLHKFHACKVRIYVDGDLVSVVPIANPVVLASKQKGKCPKKMPACLSANLDKKGSVGLNADKRLCLDCLILHSSICLARFFCEKLQSGMQRCGIALKPIDVAWNEMENKYKEVSQLLASFKSDIPFKEGMS